jgi:hypothetical protein
MQLMQPRHGQGLLGTRSLLGGTSHHIPTLGRQMHVKARFNLKSQEANAHCWFSDVVLYWLLVSINPPVISCNTAGNFDTRYFSYYFYYQMLIKPHLNSPE